MTRLWLVRLGKYGEYESRALDNKTLTIGFGIAEDISEMRDRQSMIDLMARIYPNDKAKSHSNAASQLHQFVNIAQQGDLVVSPLKTTSKIALGRFAGPYAPGPRGEVTRPVAWLKTDLPRDTFRQDLLFSFGAVQTVCEVSRNSALRRVEEVLRAGRDPGDGTAPIIPGRQTQDDATEDAADQPINLDQIARDQIERRIASVFAGHDFTRLVAAILTAQGYKTRVSPPGADAGIDIVAGSGPLGLESLRLVVQVKSGDFVVDQPTLQGLIGSIHDTHAEHGLIVSWNGYTSAVQRRVNELFFRVRLWGRQELLDNLFSAYDRLPEEIRAELPLRRTWTLVLDDPEDA